MDRTLSQGCTDLIIDLPLPPAYVNAASEYAARCVLRMTGGSLRNDLEALAKALTPSTPWPTTPLAISPQAHALFDRITRQFTSIATDRSSIDFDGTFPPGYPLHRLRLRGDKGPIPESALVERLENARDFAHSHEDEAVRADTQTIQQLVDQLRGLPAEISHKTVEPLMREAFQRHKDAPYETVVNGDRRTTVLAHEYESVLAYTSTWSGDSLQNYVHGYPKLMQDLYDHTSGSTGTQLRLGTLLAHAGFSPLPPPPPINPQGPKAIARRRVSGTVADSMSLRIGGS